MVFSCKLKWKRKWHGWLSGHAEEKSSGNSLCCDAWQRDTPGQARGWDETMWSSPVSLNSNRNGTERNSLGFLFPFLSSSKHLEYYIHPSIHPPNQHAFNNNPMCHKFKLSTSSSLAQQHHSNSPSSVILVQRLNKQPRGINFNSFSPLAVNCYSSRTATSDPPIPYPEKKVGEVYRVEMQLWKLFLVPGRRLFRLLRLIKHPFLSPISSPNPKPSLASIEALC